MAKQVCDISGSSGMSRGQSTEHLRDYKVTDPDAKKYGFYDPTRMGLNFEITKGGVISKVNKGYPIDQRFKDICRDRGIKIPGPIKLKDGTEKERNTVANIILGGSRDRMLQIAFGEQKVDLSKGADNRHITRRPEIEKWALDQYRMMCRRYGEENIVAFVVHLDEKNPHVHCTLLPVKDNKISYRKVFGGSKEEARQKLLGLHDAIAEVNKKWGLERGDSVQQTGAKHRTSEEYLLWLREECNKLETNRASLSNEVDGLKSSLQLLEKEIRKNEIKVKGLTTMVNNLTSTLSGMEKEKEQLEEDILNQEYDKQELENQKKNLDTLMQSTQGSLDRKRRDLEETKNLLEILKKQHAEKLQQVKETDEKLNKLSNLVKESESKRDDMWKGALSLNLVRYISSDIQKLFKTLEDLRDDLYSKNSFTTAGKLDDIISDLNMSWIADQPDETVNEILAVFLGDEKTANAIQISSGGGGGGNNGGWRKQKDEDLLEYINRITGMVKSSRKKGRRV